VRADLQRRFFTFRLGFCLLFLLAHQRRRVTTAALPSVLGDKLGDRTANVLAKVIDAQHVAATNLSGVDRSDRGNNRNRRVVDAESLNAFSKISHRNRPWADC
jgi:hypothetical protein